MDSQAMYLKDVTDGSDYDYGCGTSLISLLLNYFTVTAILMQCLLCSL